MFLPWIKFQLDRRWTKPSCDIGVEVAKLTVASCRLSPIRSSDSGCQANASAAVSVVREAKQLRQGVTPRSLFFPVAALLTLRTCYPF